MNETKGYIQINNLIGNNELKDKLNSVNFENQIIGKIEGTNFYFKIPLKILKKENNKIKIIFEKIDKETFLNYGIDLTKFSVKKEYSLSKGYDILVNIRKEFKKKERKFIPSGKNKEIFIKESMPFFQWSNKVRFVEAVEDENLILDSNIDRIDGKDEIIKKIKNLKKAIDNKEQKELKKILNKTINNLKETNIKFENIIHSYVKSNNDLKEFIAYINTNKNLRLIFKYGNSKMFLFLIEKLKIKTLEKINYFTKDNKDLLAFLLCGNMDILKIYYSSIKNETIDEKYKYFGKYPAGKESKYSNLLVSYTYSNSQILKLVDKKIKKSKNTSDYLLEKNSFMNKLLVFTSYDIGKILIEELGLDGISKWFIKEENNPSGLFSLNKDGELIRNIIKIIGKDNDLKFREIFKDKEFRNQIEDLNGKKLNKILKNYGKLLNTHEMSSGELKQFFKEIINNYEKYKQSTLISKKDTPSKFSYTGKINNQKNINKNKDKNSISENKSTYKNNFNGDNVSIENFDLDKKEKIENLLNIDEKTINNDEKLINEYEDLEIPEWLKDSLN